MRSGHDGAARLAIGGVQHRLDVERWPHHPCAERRRGEQPVQSHCESHPVLRWEELIKLEHAELADRRRQHHAHKGRQIEAALRIPLVEDQVRQKDVLATAERIGLDVDQAEQARHETFDLIADDLRVGAEARCLQRTNDVESDSSIRARCVDGEGCLLAKRCDAVWSEAPTGQAIGPGLGLRRREFSHADARLAGVTLVHPWLEVGGRERREGEAQVGEVTLGVDQERGHASRQRLLDEDDAQPRLARAGHAHDHPVSGEVAAGEQHVSIGAGVLSRIDQPADEEFSHSSSR